MLDDLVQLNTNIETLQVLEDKLTDLMRVPSSLKFIPAKHNQAQFNIAQTALKHQNIIGWHNFLCGYISTQWVKNMSFLSSYTKQITPQAWSRKLTKLAIELYSCIWEDRNLAVHGRTVEESRRNAREAVLHKVRAIYTNPPQLASKFPKITSIPMDQRLKCTTQQLKDWLIRVDHQMKISEFIFAHRSPGQLTIQQAFNNAKKNSCGKDKYPP